MQTATRSVLAALAALFVSSLAGQASAGVPGAVMVSVAPPLAEALAVPPSLKAQVAAEVAESAPLDAETECMAKAVHHEAANQSLEGQLAVAQLILNRTQSDKFPKTICGVVNQKGQFVHITGYQAPRHDPRWAVAVAISRIAQQGLADAVAPGALFFHATYVHPPWKKTRERVAQIGAHIFYR
jgi:spore germination cell wall hydrolase CwlJ-like protein